MRISGGYSPWNLRLRRSKGRVSVPKLTIIPTPLELRHKNLQPNKVTVDPAESFIGSWLRAHREPPQGQLGFGILLFLDEGFMVLWNDEHGGFPTIGGLLGRIPMRGTVVFWGPF